MTIDPRHNEILKAVSPSVLDGRVRSTASGLEFDWASPNGGIVTQSRPDDPRGGPKYIWPAGVRLPVGVPNGMEALVADPKVPLLIVEGTKQHLAAASTALTETDPAKRLAVVGIGGCWGWRQDDKPLDDFLDIPMEGREVVVVFDADISTNHDVHNAAEAFGEYLSIEAGAKEVRYAKLPGRKDGLDDILGRVRTPLVTLHRIVDEASRSLGRKPARPAPFVSQWFDQNGRFLVHDLFRAISDAHSLAITQDQTIAVYIDGRYRNGSSREFNRIAVEQLGNDYTTMRLKNLTELSLDILKTTGQEIPLRPGRLLINVKNGLLDPVTLTLHPHDPEFRTLWQFDVAWNPDAECPTYEQWIEEVLPGRALELEDAVCPMLDPTRTPSRAVFLFGPSRSGKSTYARLLKRMVGAEATSAVSLHQLSDDRFAAANLLDKRLNLAMDLSNKEVRDLSIFKMILGDDTIQANRKFGAQFAFENQALIVFSANEVPAVSEVSKAYLARMAPFEFPNSFLGSEDPKIEAAMMGEVEGIFRRLVLALHARLKRGNRYLESKHADNEKFRLASNKTAQFLHERTVADDTGTERPNIFLAYKMWCEANGSHPLGRNRFNESLRTEGVEEYKPKGGAWRWKLALVDPDKGHEVGSSAVVGSSGPPPLEGIYTSTSEVCIPYGGSSSELPTSTGTADVLPFDLETASAADLFAGRPDFVRICHSTRGSGVQHVLDHLRDGGTLAAHNGFMFDFHALGLDVTALGDRLIDTKVLAILDHPPLGRRPADTVLRDYSAQALADRYGFPGKTADIKVLAKRHGGFDQIPLDDEEYNRYCAQDAAIVQNTLDAIPMTDYARREMRVMARLAGPITGTGFRVDVALLGRRIAEGESVRRTNLDRLISYGMPDHGKSPQATKVGKQAIVDAFAALGVTVPTTAKGSPALGKDGLGALSLEGEAAELQATVLGLNGIRTVYQTIDANRTGDRVHPTVMPSQASGRFSVRNPGLTVLGKREGRFEERAVLLPDEGDVLLSFDLDQIDARAVAVHSQDVEYLKMFAPGMDSHAEVGRLLGLPREQAKAIAHGWNYGEGIRKLIANTGLPEATVRQFDQGMRERFPRLVQWRNEMYELGRSGVELDNGFGRRLKVDPESAYTQAAAYMGQSAARDLMCEGVLALPLEVARMVRAFIHDEIILSVPAGSVDDVRAAVLDALTFEWAPEGASEFVRITAGCSRPGANLADCYRKEPK
jgi:P4 family phage/plasmid primase-like protien